MADAGGGAGLSALLYFAAAFRHRQSRRAVVRAGADAAGGGWFAFGDGGAAALQINAELYWRIPLLGVISAVALVCYILASRLLPFSLFGLLSYVEPVLLVIVALLLGESIGQSEWPTYLAIWLAVLLLAAEGAQHLLRRQQV